MKATALELEACYDVRPLAGVRVPLASLERMIGRRALDPGQQLLALVLGPQRGLPIFSGSGVSGSQLLTGWGCSCTESGKCVQFVEPCPVVILLLKFDLVLERQQGRVWGLLSLPATCICAMDFVGRPLPLLSFPVASPNDLHSAKALPNLWRLSGSERALSLWATRLPFLRPPESVQGPALSPTCASAAFRCPDGPAGRAVARIRKVEVKPVGENPLAQGFDVCGGCVELGVHSYLTAVLLYGLRCVSLYAECALRTGLLIYLFAVVHCFSKALCLQRREPARNRMIRCTRHACRGASVWFALGWAAYMLPVGQAVGAPCAPVDRPALSPTAPPTEAVFPHPQPAGVPLPAGFRASSGAADMRTQARLFRFQAATEVIYEWVGPFDDVPYLCKLFHDEVFPFG